MKRRAGTRSGEILQQPELAGRLEGVRLLFVGESHTSMETHRVQLSVVRGLVEAGREVLPEELAAMMLELQDQGCHNINFVTPEHVVPQMLEALPHAIRRVLRPPIVYNTSAFDAIASLRHMDGLVDIYMPDLQYWPQAFH